MAYNVIPIPSRKLGQAGMERLPLMIARAGEKASWRFIEFFTANIRNKNTRAAYAVAVTELSIGASCTSCKASWPTARLPTRRGGRCATLRLAVRRSARRHERRASEAARLDAACRA